MLGQAQDPCHVATADFGSRFTDLSIELGVLLDDEDARFRAFALEHERGGRS